ncbi:MAG TPA: ATP-binding protein [Rhodocyclaceae bacterium]
MTTSHTLRLADAAPPGLPAAPRTLEETGLSYSLLLELVVKTLFLHGELRLADLVQAIALPPGVLTPLLGLMRSERLCEVTRRGDTDGRTSYSLTETGRARADDFLRRSQYVGVAPVGLQDYVAQVERQSVARMGVSQERLQRVFEGVVVSDGLLGQLGAAMNSNRPIFIYGPSGSGKTFLAERLAGALSGAVAVPHALAVGSEVIRVFDPLVHRPLPAPPGTAFDRGAAGDARWALCRRPVVMSGAELTLAMVDLEFDTQTRFYHAPQQLKANNGLFVIDDLGRQIVPAQSLMNRWIVPLDRRTDFLTLHTGQKFELPFDVVVVFSSNMAPAQLGDEAFLRRLGYKIFVGPVGTDEYRAITEQVCRALHVPFDAAGFAHLLGRHKAERRPLLACQPRDLLGQVRDYAVFNGVPPQMAPELLDWAWNNYFAPQDHAPRAAAPTARPTGDVT